MKKQTSHSDKRAFSENVIAYQMVIQGSDVLHLYCNHVPVCPEDAVGGLEDGRQRGKQAHASFMLLVESLENYLRFIVFYS